MTRVIKFRAWGKNSKEFLRDVVGGEVIYGFTLKEIQNIEGIDGWEFSQFTGLRDKNGREIYEGDVVKFVRKVGKQSVTLIEAIEWDEVDASFGGGGFNIWMMRDTTVIGNIYENPELLGV